MAIVVVNKNIYKVDSLYQWDKNQDLEIQGLSLPTIPEIHFTNDAMDRAIVRQATMDDKGIITVEIPNSLLQKPYKITAYVCIYEDETFKSLYKLEIPVKARKKPGDYTLENDEEVYSFNALENLVNNTLVVLTEKCEETIERADEYYNKTIVDTTTVKDEAIEEITEVKNTGVSALTQIKENAVNEMNIIKNNTINEATEIKNEAIEECERIKEEIQNSSNDSLAEDIEELRDDLDNHITEMTPISQIIEGSTKPITSGAVYNFKDELTESFAKYNPETDELDIYCNGVIVGSLPCKFNIFDVLNTSQADWILTSDSDNRVTKLETTINSSNAKFVTTWNIGAMNTYTAYIRYAKKYYNLTNFKKIKFVASFTGSGTALNFGISLVNVNTNVRTIIFTKNTGSAMAISCDENIDISNYSGNYYIEIFSNSSSNPYPSIIVTSMYLE